MNLYKKAYILVITILVQGAIVFIMANRYILDYIGNTMMIYRFYNLGSVFALGLGLTSIVNLGFILKFLDNERQSIEKLNNSQEVINALKAQKHDFLNHLAVIDGFLQLQKHERASGYIRSICGQVEQGFNISGIENLEIQALLYRKLAIAENKGIEVKLDIQTDLANIDISSINLCKIIFNLIDNAIYELENGKDEEKILTISFVEENTFYYISITNSTPVLPKELYNRVFEQGYSTKAGGDHGFGLSIVKTIVKQNKGSIKLESSEEMGTRFTIILPISNNDQEESQIMHVK